MSDLRTIEIDFEIHKMIEAERKSFAEHPNVALRRLLGLGVMAAASEEHSSERDWFGDGVKLPHGTELRMTYNKRLSTGRIKDGAWVVQGATYSSPSAAAGGTARTKNGGQTSLDGWKYWEVKVPGELTWKPLSRLRWV